MPHYVLDGSALQVGDIILKRSESSESQVIRRANGSAFSHALLYVGRSSCIESDGLGVRSQNVRRVVVDDPDSIAVYRAPGVTREAVDQAVRYARMAIGTEYGSSEARRARMPREEPALEPNRQFCTRIVAQAYQSAGVPLSPNADYCGPSDLEQSVVLERVDVPVLPISDEEAELAASPSILDRQLDVQNDLLEASRAALGVDVQTLQQLVQAVLDQPGKDGVIAEILRGSGFLAFGDETTRTLPHLYDYSTFVVVVPNEEKDKVAASMLREPETRAHWEASVPALKEAAERSGLQVPAILGALFERQVLLSRIRESVGEMHVRLGLQAP
jgi:hypothetical protein